MDTPHFWALIEDARSGPERDPGGAAVTNRACALLAALPREEIIAAQQVLWDLMAFSYRSPLWAAAYLINGGCSDDGFDYFRGWLITRGRDAFERVVADPDALAGLPAACAAAAAGTRLECEEILSIALDAYRAATGGELPSGAVRVQRPPLDPDWDFDFDDHAEMARRLPRLAALGRG